MGRLWYHFLDKGVCELEIKLLCQRLMNVGHNPETLDEVFKEAAKKL